MRLARNNIMRQHARVFFLTDAVYVRDRLGVEGTKFAPKPPPTRRRRCQRVLALEAESACRPPCTATTTLSLHRNTTP